MIKNIAVCLYGRFGTGEYCAPSILKFFKNTLGVNVDFFCATKDYDNYYRTKYNRSRDDITMIGTEYLTDMLAVYNPKDTVIVNYETDLGRRVDDWNTGPMFSQICESIMLKSNYEASNDMQYDVVFVTRYDILFDPSQSDYLDQYITWHNKEFINKQYDIFRGIGDSWMFNVPVNVTSPKIAYQDMLFFGSSMTMDLVASNSLLLTNDQHYKTNKKTHIYPESNNRGGHQSLGFITRQSNISVANYPCFNTDGNTSGEWHGNTLDGIRITLVRDFGDMTHASISTEAYHRNIWTWVNDKPFSQNPQYIIEVQQEIDKHEQELVTLTKCINNVDFLLKLKKKLLADTLRGTIT
tara:strand:+ start:119 stop:1177 length:1059 start_codon:yes stop_codon:yes gene_type:complete